MSNYIKYEHWGRDVWVKEEDKGQHRKYCLCWGCMKFDPNDRNENCPIANAVYSLCVLQNLVLPVWECPEFEDADQ